MQEEQILFRIHRYFLSGKMSLEDKLFYAKLIATLDLESGNYTEEKEKRGSRCLPRKWINCGKNFAIRPVDGHLK
ncbi:hypothetical protein [Heliobacterium chlorum]|uniref:hypothetical protein n=1 Tax=Heliobacterium chlorum TaxID=2698 RepID=UPI001FADE789|nr:hypothetical protein [Heliobacterium chlorum]